MLSSNDLERLIAEKRYELGREKIDLGLSRSPDNNVEENKENKKVQISKKVSEHNYVKEDNLQRERRSSLEEDIPADLERYIRRCTGLPVMLKAGEYSPNNPLVRGDRPGPGGDVMLGLGEYERRRNTLRRIRQQQYREYLDQQAKLKQEAKEKAERERREREEKERAREEEERERERREIEIASPVRRRASLNYGHDFSSGSNNTYITKVDTGVQVESIARPLSVAVQTEDVGLYPVPQVHQKLTQAERELSPRVAGEGTHKWTEDWTNWKERRRSYGDFDEPSSVRKSNKEKLIGDLRHTYMPSIFDADVIQLRNMQAEKEAAARRQLHQQELRDQILEQQRIRDQRNTREKMLEEAEMRRLEEQLRALKSAHTRETYRQVEQNEYMKQQSSEYEKKRATLQNEIEKEKKTLLRSTSHKPVTNVTRDTTLTSHSETKPPFYYQNKTNKPPYSINIPENSIFSQNYDIESYLRKNLNPSRESLMSNNLRELRTHADNINKSVKDKTTRESYTENKIRDNYTDHKSTRDNYTDHKNTRENYTENKTRDNYTDHKNTRDNYTENKTRDNYTDHKNTRDNYTENKTRENYTDHKNTRDNYVENKTRENYTENKNTRQNYTDRKNTQNYTDNKNNNIIIEKALIHTQPKRKEDTLPIPVLKHSPVQISNDINENTELSKAMQIVDDKWKIPAVQKNILKTLPKEDGNINILTQLGSIRRQLQLEQMKLDMIEKDDV